LSQAELNGVNNPNPPVGIPEMPKGLTKVGRRYWRLTIQQLIDIPGLLTIVDGPLIYDYCTACADVEALNKDIAKNGYTFVTHFEDREGNLVVGDIKANPAVALRDKAIARKQSFADRFGFSPVARAKIKLVPQKKEVDPLEAYLQSKKKDDSSGGAPPALPMCVVR
jgi:P27 family predicted phage terminase small subunit